MNFYKTKNILVLLIFIFLNQFSNAKSSENKIIESSTPNYYENNSFSNKIIGNEYLLGAGDSILLNIFGLPELSGEFGIGPDGMIYLPQLKDGIQVNLVTLEEFKKKLIDEYKKILFEPNITIQLAKIRPIRVFIKGEVKLPGFYNLSISDQNFTINSSVNQNPNSIEEFRRPNLSQNNLLLPTLYDALKKANGLTPYSELSSITVIRNNSITKGGGKIKTQLDFLSLFLTGDQSQNIRLFDGDTIIVNKSKVSLKDQMLEVKNSNINPTLVNIFVSGKVPNGGYISVPRGSGLVQAVEVSGGKQLISGKVEFVRFMKNGEIDRRLISYKIDSALDSRSNPILEDGDIINVQDSLFGKSTEVMNKVLRPVTPILFIQSLLN